MQSSIRRSEVSARASMLMSSGIDLTRRKMIVGVPYMEHNVDSDVNFALAANFSTGLHILEHLYVPPAGEASREHIEIEFVSYGGDLSLSLGIFDRIIMVDLPVHMYVYGPCMSGGSLILQAATKRFISPLGSLMMHYGQTWDEGSSDPIRMKEVVRHHTQLMDQLVGVYLTRCNKRYLREKKLRELLRIETYLDAPTCVKYGLADAIIEPITP